MKKLNIMVFIILACFILAHSQSVRVTSPRATDVWEKNNSYNITWAVSGCSSPNVKINIFRNSIDPANFVEQLIGPNSGSQRWTIPGRYTDGNYIIRIKTDPAETGCIGDSAVFKIGTGAVVQPLIPALTVKATIPPISKADLRIDRVVRANSLPLRAGDPLNLNVFVVNSSNVSANVCIATPAGKDEGFYKKGECHIINGNTTSIYFISVPFIRTNLKSGQLKSTVFLTDANKTGTLFSVMWKDTNNTDNLYSFSYPYELPDLVVVAITRVEYSRIVNKQKGTFLTIRVKNQGNAPSTPGKIGAKDYISYFFGGTCGVKGYIDFFLPAIAPGETKTGILKFPCQLVFGYDRDHTQGGFTPGREPTRADYRIDLFVNPKGGIVESDFTNNKLSLGGERIEAFETNEPKPNGFEAIWR